jgi:O-acetyl-ADP-ribose deacetylase (regulator of RNase III)
MTHNGKVARYYAVIDGFRYILSEDTTIEAIAIPKIGCGLGGCKWEVMEELLREIENDFYIKFWVYEL